MKCTTILTFAILVFCCLPATRVWAQPSSRNYRQPVILLETTAGGTTYKGELHPQFSRWGAVASIGIRFNFKKRLNGALRASYGKISGQSLEPLQLAESTTPAPYFATSFLSAQYHLHLNLLKTRKFQVFVAQGAGFMRFDPRDEQQQSLSSQATTRPPGQEYATTTAVLPTSLGAIALLPNGYGAGIRTELLNPLSDYLDNLSLPAGSGNIDQVFSIQATVLVPLSFYQEYSRKNRKKR